MREYQTWREYLIEKLAADLEGSIDYLDVALEEYQSDKDPRLFLVALQTVVEAQGGVSELAKKTNIKPQVLSDVFTGEKALRLDVFSAILSALGCRLSVEPLNDASFSLDCGDENYPDASKKVADPNLEVATESNNPR